MLHGADFDEYAFVEQLREWERRAIRENRVNDAKIYRQLITYIENGRMSQRPHVHTRI